MAGDAVTRGRLTDAQMTYNKAITGGSHSNNISMVHQALTQKSIWRT
jgi:hypothetical protein